MLKQISRLMVLCSALLATGAANPYSFYGSVAECASAQETRCIACLPGGSCEAITNGGNGNTECTTFGLSDGRGYFLMCVNLALSIDAVASCTASRAPQCPRNTQASASLSSLDGNAEFLDDATCGGALDACLTAIYGAPKSPFPGPGVDAGVGGAPPRNTAVECSDSGWAFDGDGCSGDSCSGSDDESGCDSGSGDSCSSDSCSSDSGDSCDSGNSSSCDSGDSGGDCGGGGGGGCGNDSCNVAGKPRGGGHGIATLSTLWAFLPLPFAALMRRRALRRRRARQAVDHDEAL